MDTDKSKKAGSVSFSLISALACFWVCYCLLLSSCGADNTPLPITSNIIADTPSIPTSVPTDTLVPTFPVLIPPTPTCVNGLSFISDVTIPDFSVVASGSLLDKQWLVQNSGSCNWDNHYRLRLIAGDELGASLEQALFPARAGTQASLRIVFSAPLVPGEYLSEWQAFDAQGVPFGDSFFIKLIVQ
jgi:hypothetical protein